MLVLKDQGNSNSDIAEQLGFSEQQVVSKLFYMAQCTQVGVERNEPECRDSLFALYPSVENLYSIKSASRL